MPELADTAVCFIGKSDLKIPYGCLGAPAVRDGSRSLLLGHADPGKCSFFGGPNKCAQQRVRIFATALMRLRWSLAPIRPLFGQHARNVSKERKERVFSPAMGQATFPYFPESAYVHFFAATP